MKTMQAWHLSKVALFLTNSARKYFNEILFIYIWKLREDIQNAICKYRSKTLCCIRYVQVKTVVILMYKIVSTISYKVVNHLRPRVSIIRFTARSSVRYISQFTQITEVNVVKLFLLNIVLILIILTMFR